jgi:hypothetical protein
MERVRFYKVNVRQLVGSIESSIMSTIKGLLSFGIITGVLTLAAHAEVPVCRVADLCHAAERW